MCLDFLLLAVTSEETSCRIHSKITKWSVLHGEVSWYKFDKRRTMRPDVEMEAQVLWEIGVEGGGEGGREGTEERQLYITF